VTEPTTTAEAIKRALGITHAPPGEEVRCVVAHPAAGGPCKRIAVPEVYGLPLCKAHGEEAEASALAELDEAIGFYLAAATPAVGSDDVLYAGSALGEALERVLRDRPRFCGAPTDNEGVSEELTTAAYPFAEELLDERTKTWTWDEPTYPYGMHPVDYWNERRWLFLRMMRMVYQWTPRDLLRDLELMCEEAVAQRGFASKLSADGCW